VPANSRGLYGLTRGRPVRSARIFRALS